MANPVEMSARPMNPAPNMMYSSAAVGSRRGRSVWDSGGSRYRMQSKRSAQWSAYARSSGIVKSSVVKPMGSNNAGGDRRTRCPIPPDASGNRNSTRTGPGSNSVNSNEPFASVRVSSATVMPSTFVVETRTIWSAAGVPLACSSPPRNVAESSGAIVVSRKTYS